MITKNHFINHSNKLLSIVPLKRKNNDELKFGWMLTVEFLQFEDDDKRRHLELNYAFEIRKRHWSSQRVLVYIVVWWEQKWFHLFYFSLFSCKGDWNRGYISNFKWWCWNMIWIVQSNYHSLEIKDQYLHILGSCSTHILSFISVLQETHSTWYFGYFVLCYSAHESKSQQNSKAIISIK